VRTAAITVFVVAMLPASACGQSAEHQRQVAFVQHCAACHAIAQGQPSPVPAARNLWDMQPSEGQLRQAIEHGADGMPARLVHGGDEGLVIDYVLEKTAR
jgi:mono/diheme cytochrome c family protein